MKIHVARQPIYNRRLKVYGYELLYRVDAEQNAYDPTHSPDSATSRVIIDGFQGMGIETLVGGKKAFINFTENLLRHEVATLFSKETLVVEILETVHPDEEIIEKCRTLKNLGYQIALDDFVLTPEYLPMLALTDIIKIDFQNTAPATIKALVGKLKNRAIRFLAEKVETYQEFRLALSLGFTYFQGYFLSHPTIVSAETLRPLPTNYMRLLHVVLQEDFDMFEVSGIIRQDVALSYGLLRLVNSVAFGFRNRIESIHHAIVALGMNEARKWVTLVVMVGVNRDNPTELIYMSLIRARMMQNLATLALKYRHADIMFLIGLFSMIDTIIGCELKSIIFDVPMPDDARKALLERKGPYAPYLELVLHQEQANWEHVAEYTARLSLHPKAVQDAYNEAVQWCTMVFETQRPRGDW